MELRIRRTNQQLATNCSIPILRDQSEKPTFSHWFGQQHNLLFFLGRNIKGKLGRYMTKKASAKLQCGRFKHFILFQRHLSIWNAVNVEVVKELHKIYW